MNTATNNSKETEMNTSTTEIYRAALSAADEAGRAYIKELQDAGRTADADRVAAEVDAICEARKALPRLFANLGK